MNGRFETFTIQIAKVSRLIRKIKTEEVKEFNLKSPHVSCLYFLYKQNKNQTAKEICEAVDEDKAAISRSLDYLEKNGFIECFSKTEKRYKSPLSLTEKGKTIAEQIAKKIDKVLNLASEGLSNEDREVFYKSLILIGDNLQKISENYGE